MKKTITRAAAAANKKKGLIIVNTGDGKGKTTAALGVALRACGYGMRVIMLQFFKGKWKCGELRSAPRLGSFEIHPMGQGFTWESKDIEVDKAMVRAAGELRHRDPGRDQLRAELRVSPHRGHRQLPENQTVHAPRHPDGARC